MNPIPRKFTASEVHIKQVDGKYQGFFKIDQYTMQIPLFQGGLSHPIERELCLRRPAVGVLAFDPKLDQIVLIEQFRTGALQDKRSPWQLEIIAGLVEDGEKLEEVAQRELQEEAGLITNKLTKILDYWVTPGSSNEHFTLFLAEVDATNASGIHGLEEEGENILVRAIPSATAFLYLEQGIINNAPAVIALQWLKLKLKKD